MLHCNIDRGIFVDLCLVDGERQLKALDLPPGKYWRVDSNLLRDLERHFSVLCERHLPRLTARAEIIAHCLETVRNFASDGDAIAGRQKLFMIRAEPVQAANIHHFSKPQKKASDHEEL